MAVGDTLYVVVFDVVVEVLPVDEAPAVMMDSFTLRNGWGPRSRQGNWVCMVMAPQQIQTWQSEEELSGRDVMLEGKWLA